MSELQPNRREYIAGHRNLFIKLATEYSLDRELLRIEWQQFLSYLVAMEAGEAEENVIDTICLSLWDNSPIDLEVSNIASEILFRRCFGDSENPGLTAGLTGKKAKKVDRLVYAMKDLLFKNVGSNSDVEV